MAIGAGAVAAGGIGRDNLGATSGGTRVSRSWRQIASAGLLAYRELDEVLSLTEMVAEVLSDSRPGTNKQHGTIDNVPSLEWFQVDPNGKSRIRKE
jgi:hypothetical protein